ncbi:MAG: radical SAM protein [Candidatus Omnitrophota bacterium]
MLNLFKKRRQELPGILLIQLPPWDHRVAPLGIAYLATFLKSRGIMVEVRDLNIELYNSGVLQRGWNGNDSHWWKAGRSSNGHMPLFEGMGDTIASYDMPVIGFSATMDSIPFLNQILRILKNKAPDKIIVIGGPATFFDEIRKNDFVKGYVDYFVIGDGEFALLEILNGLRDKGKLRLSDRGIFRVWKDHAGDRAVCIKSMLPTDLDAVPFPTFEGFDLSLYTEGMLCCDFTLPLIFSKGCTRNCTFCSDRILSHPYRCRKAGHVLREMVLNQSRYNNSCFRLNDLAFNADLKFLEELCDCIVDEGLQVKWYGQAQIRPEIDAQLFLKLRKAGCTEFSLGLESFSDHVLSLMGKGYTAFEAERFLRFSKEAGIRNDIALIVGYPGETEEDFQETLAYIKRNVAYIDRVCSMNICGAPVGSALRAEPLKYKYMFHGRGYTDWMTLDGTNTYKVRKKRYTTAVKYCEDLGIPVYACLDLEIFEEDAPPERTDVNQLYP